MAVGKTRIRLAKLLQENFPISGGGLALTWEPENLYPATGSYRTNINIDCCRWEGFAQHYRPDGSYFHAVAVHSYSTMTELLKSKHLQILSSGDVAAYDPPLNQEAPLQTSEE